MYLEKCKKLFHKIPIYIKSYLLFELGYYIYSKLYTYRYLENIQYKDVREYVSHKKTKELYEQVKLYMINEPDLSKYISDAFLDKDLITLPNISTLLSYLIYNTPNKNVNELLAIVKIKCAGIIKPYGPLSYRNMSSLMMTNNLNIVHKPFAFYAYMYFIRRAFNCYMYTFGFTNIVDPSTNLRVWVKYNKAASNKIPLVFIHGFGLGIVPYIEKIHRLSRDRTLILPELPNISYDLYKFPPPSADNIANTLYNMLTKLDIELVDIIGHSYGTLILNIFQMKYPHMCNYKTYGEPVCFYIHQTHMISTTYKLSRISNYTYILDYLSYLFIYRDIYIQYITRRTFFMEHFFIKNLDDKTNIILAKDDNIIPYLFIYNYITKYYPYVKVSIIDGGHGSFLFM